MQSNNNPLRNDPDDEERPSNIEDGPRRRARRLAQAALKLYGLRDAEADLLRHGFVLVFRGRSASRGEFALRLYGLPGGTRQPDPGSLLTAAMLRSPRVLDSQLRWLSDLGHDTGLPVPEPLRTLDGELVGRVTVEGTPWRRHSALVRWVPGVHKGEDLTEADLLRVGSFVGRMHDHAEGYAAPEGSEFPRWDWDWPFGEAALLWSEGRKFYSGDEMATFCQAARRSRERLDELGGGRGVFGLIHQDITFRIVVFSNEGLGLIDFDMCGLGYYLFDLSAFRSNLQRTLPAARWGSAWGAFLRGYEGVRPLPEHIRAHLDRYLVVFGAMRRVAMVNRRLELLSSDTTKPEARARSMHFLRKSPGWLRRRLK